MKRTALMIAILALFGSQLYAWNPVNCSADDLASRSKLASHMRTSKPDDPVYAPKPFPKNDTEIIEDFYQQVQILLNGSTHPLIEGGKKALRRAIDQAVLHIGIVRESNWQGNRCLRPRAGETLYLLRLYDTTTATEVARATLDESGLINELAYPTDRKNPIWAKPLPLLDEGTKILSAAVGARVLEIQYATSFGTINCDSLAPCIVGKISGRDGYAILSLDGIYTFNTASRRVDRGGTPDSLDAFRGELKGLAPHEGMMTIGGKSDVVVTKIAERP